MILTRLQLNTKNKQVQSELVHPYEMHRTLSRCFDKVDQRILFRVLNTQFGVSLVVKTDTMLNYDILCSGDYLENKNIEIRSFSQSEFSLGDVFSFNLRGNPTMRVNGRRIPTRADDWLLTRAKTKLGVDILELNTKPPVTFKGRKEDKSITIKTVDYMGILKVMDVNKFFEALRSGVGPAKAFGCGLLLFGPQY